MLLDAKESIIARLCCIEIQVRSNLDRGLFLVLYLACRASFWVLIMHKILFPNCGRYSGGSLEPRTCIGAGFGDPKFLYRAQPCIIDEGIRRIGQRVVRQKSAHCSTSFRQQTETKFCWARSLIILNQTQSYSQRMRSGNRSIR